MTESRNKIFISYRRSDSEDATGRLYENLKDRFGPRRIFKDVDSIPPGINFSQHITSSIAESKVMLVVIGRSWLETTDENGDYRLNNPNDFVRIEIESGLNDPNIRVIPILVGRATRPVESKLPESLTKLLRLQELQLRPDPDFENDIKVLIRTLDGILGNKISKKIIGIGAAVLIIISTAFGIGKYFNSDFRDKSLADSLEAAYQNSQTESLPQSFEVRTRSGSVQNCFIDTTLKVNRVYPGTRIKVQFSGDLICYTHRLKDIPNPKIEVWVAIGRKSTMFEGRMDYQDAGVCKFSFPADFGISGFVAENGQIKIKIERARLFFLDRAGLKRYIELKAGEQIRIADILSLIIFEDKSLQRMGQVENVKNSFQS